jgi:hypothetical protein
MYNMKGNKISYETEALTVGVEPVWCKQNWGPSGTLQREALRTNKGKPAVMLGRNKPHQNFRHTYG